MWMAMKILVDTFARRDPTSFVDVRERSQAQVPVVALSHFRPSILPHRYDSFSSVVAVGVTLKF
jgi:hypothetical protein